MVDVCPVPTQVFRLLCTVMDLPTMMGAAEHVPNEEEFDIFWTGPKSCLKVNSTVLVVSPCSTDPDIMRKAEFLLKLLHRTPVPAPLATDLALHGRQHDLITLGTLKDGMCVEYRITRDVLQTCPGVC